MRVVFVSMSEGEVGLVAVCMRGPMSNRLASAKNPTVQVTWLTRQRGDRGSAFTPCGEPSDMRAWDQRVGGEVENDHQGPLLTHVGWALVCTVSPVR